MLSQDMFTKHQVNKIFKLSSSGVVCALQMMNRALDKSKHILRVTSALPCFLPVAAHALC